MQPAGTGLPFPSGRAAGLCCHSRSAVPHRRGAALCTAAHRIRARSRLYLSAFDALPAGFEALNESLGATSHLAAAYEEPVFSWEEHGYNRKQVRDESVTFFVDQLAPGQHTYTYLMRATSAGSFTAMPTQVYPMYEPEVWSRSESIRLQVETR
jgi:uncharacterized protein YfaS (alpha-2-macroglobulin family)